MNGRTRGTTGFSGLAVACTGLLLLAIGVFLGMQLGRGRVQAATPAITPGASTPESLEATVAELAAELRALREDQASWELAWESEAALRRSEARARDDSLTLLPTSAEERVPLGEPQPYELEGFNPAAIEARLNEISSLQRRLLAAFQSRSSNQLLRIPPDVSLIDWFKALKEVDSDIVNESHELMSMAQIQQQYGLPDKVIERDDYIEWVYFLDPEEETQFDFHFVAGLCTIAH